MTEAEFQLSRSVAFVAAAALALALQRALPHSGYRGSWRTNTGLWAANAVTMLVVCGACASAVSQWSAATGWGLLHRVAAPPPLALFAGVLALDAVAYVWHRMNHRIGWLWRFHRVHHSDASFTATTALRFHPGEVVLSLPLRLATVALLGVPVSGVLLFEALFAFSNFFEHSDTRLSRRMEGWLQRAFITPALHRLHHSQVRGERDSNYGTILSLWDRVFASYRDTSSQRRVDVGLPGLPAALNLAGALTLPARPAPRGH